MSIKNVGALSPLIKEKANMPLAQWSSEERHLRKQSHFESDSEDLVLKLSHDIFFWQKDFIHSFIQPNVKEESIEPSTAALPAAEL